MPNASVKHQNDLDVEEHLLFFLWKVTSTVFQQHVVVPVSPKLDYLFSFLLRHDVDRGGGGSGGGGGGYDGNGVYVCIPVTFYECKRSLHLYLLIHHM